MDNPPKPKEMSPVSEAMLDCKNWPKQEEKVKGFDEERAFKYISGDEMLALGVLIPRMLGKEVRGMRPDTFVLLLGKLSKEHLKAVFENIKQNNLFVLLQDIAKRDPSLVSELGALQRKSGVDFGNESAPKAKVTSPEPEVSAEDLEDAEQKITLEYLNLKEEANKIVDKIKKDHAYSVTSATLEKNISPNEKITEVALREIKVNIFDFEKLHDIIAETRVFIADKLNGDVKYRDTGSFKHDHEVNGYKLLFQREGKGLDQAYDNWIENLQKFEFSEVVRLFSEHLQNPNRYEEHLKELKDKEHLAKRKTQ